MRRWSAYVLFVVAALLVALAGLAGLANREVLDGPGFVANVEHLRQDPRLASAIGNQVADAAVARRADLVAVKPLVAQISATVIASDAAGPIFRSAANQAHAAFTTADSDQVVLRLADFGAVVSAVLREVSPQAAAAIPADLPVRLAVVGGQGGAIGRVVQGAHLAATLAWLLPLLALACVLAGGVVHPGRRGAVLGAGAAVSAGGVLLLLTAAAGQWWSSSLDRSSLAGAAKAALWAAFGQPLFRIAALTVVLGGLLAAIAASGPGYADIRGWVSQLPGRLASRPQTTGLAVLRAVAIGLGGLGLIFWTERTLSALAVLIGLGAAVYAVLDLNRLVTGVGAQGELGATEAQPARGQRPRHRAAWLVPAGLGSVLALLAGFPLALNARAPDRTVSASQGQGPMVCAGHAELCDRRFTEVAWAAAHNAMSAEDQGFYLAEQPTSLVGMLDAGVRVLLIDTWYGQPVANGRSITATSNFTAAAQQAEQAFAPEILQSVERLTTSIQSNGGPPSGPVQPYLCHTFCEIGGTPLLPALQGVQAWMSAHPTEVVTLFIQDAVTPADTAKVFDRAGLTRYAYHSDGIAAPWPTLRAMVESGRRLVVLMENQGGGDAYPWLLPGFDYVQDTGYTYPTVASFDCGLKRGRPDSPLFLLNHWLSGFSTLYTDAQTVNAYAVLSARGRQCQAERGRLPNFVAVNWANLGALQRVVDELNGF